MKSLKLTMPLFASAALFSSLAIASVSYKGEVMPIATSPCTWTGFYAGLNLGLVKHTMDITDTNAAYFNATLEQTLNPKLTGGLQVGYRKQLELTRISGVYGIELSANFSNAKFSKQYGSPFAFYQLNSKHELKNLALLQLLGGIAVERTLLFLAAGISWVNISGSTTNVDGIPFSDSFTTNKKQWGTALGGGIEYMINSKISARFKVDVISPNTYTTHDNVGNSYQIANNIVQATVGLNYTLA